MKYFTQLVGRIESAELVIDMILAENNLSYHDLKNKGMKSEQTASDARHEVAYCLREILNFKEAEVAIILGYTNIRSVFYAKKKVMNLISVDKNYREKIEKFKIHVEQFNALSDLF